MNLYLKLFCFLCCWQESLHWYYRSSEHLRWHSTWPALPHHLPLAVNKNWFLMTSTTFLVIARTFKLSIFKSNVSYCALWGDFFWVTAWVKSYDNHPIGTVDLLKKSLHKGNWTEQLGKDKIKSTQHDFLLESQN